VRTRLLHSVLAFVLLAGAPASAAILPVDGTYTLIFTRNVPPATVTGSGVGASNGLGGSASVPAGLFAGNPPFAAPIFPTFVGLTNVTIPANSVNNPAQTFDLGGSMGLSGAAFFNTGTAGRVPLAPLGGGGTAMGVIQSIRLTVVGGTWKYSAAKVFTQRGAALSNALFATATAYDNRTASGQGTVQLVAAAYALVDRGTLANLPVFATLALTYTPEPGTLVLFGAGVAALAAIGRTRTARP
jgi:hypothetical protein